MRVIREICRYTVAGIWFYQALAPKLLGPHPDELALAAAFGIPPELRVHASFTAAALELLVGLSVLVFHRYAWPQLLSAALMAILLAFVAIYAPGYLIAAFNPVVMNCTSIALSAVAVVAMQCRSARD